MAPTVLVTVHLFDGQAPVFRYSVGAASGFGPSTLITGDPWDYIAHRLPWSIGDGYRYHVSIIDRRTTKGGR
jgi:hypothetical protein